MNTIDPSFGHWLAGFVDGEGAFILSRVTSKKGNPHGKTWPSARFEIFLRADDVGLLETIRETLGIGVVRMGHHGSATKPNQKPTARFAVWRVGECLEICDLFDQFELRGKKGHQFALWSEGVREMARGSFRDDALIDTYRAELAKVRVYDQAILDGWVPEARPVLVHRADHGDPPLCLCGCGQPTKVRKGSPGIPHPDNHAFRRFLAGHHTRVALK